MSRPARLAPIQAGRHFAKAHGPLRPVVGRVREIGEVIAARQEKVLVFTQFREVTAPLAAHLGAIFGREGLVLHGGTAVKKRQDLVRRFQEDETVPFFVLSLKAGGTGLNLTAASHVVHFDRWWNPAVENQGTDRAFRIGQVKNVLVHKLVCRGRAEMYYGWRPYVPVHVRRLKAERELARLEKKGQSVSPVVILGRKIATTFWGQSWCRNLEGYSDYSNRLPRGRTYVRNGSVVDLRIAPGEVSARVSGSSLYKVRVDVAAVPKPRWSALCKDCAGGIDSLVELLQGRLSKGVMERICRQKTGLFPSPGEIAFTCSCPDWASMCKHVAAVLYGVGARLDERPALLFTLRKVDEKDLIAKAGKDLPLARKGPVAGKILNAKGLSEIFGIEMAEAGAPANPRGARPGLRRDSRWKKTRG